MRWFYTHHPALISPLSAKPKDMTSTTKPSHRLEPAVPTSCHIFVELSSVNVILRTPPVYCLLSTGYCLLDMADLSFLMPPRDLWFAELCLPGAVYFGYQISTRNLKGIKAHVHQPMEVSSTSHPAPKESLPWQGSHHSSSMPFIPFHVFSIYYCDQPAGISLRPKTPKSFSCC